MTGRVDAQGQLVPSHGMLSETVLPVSQHPSASLECMRLLAEEDVLGNGSQETRILH